MELNFFVCVKLAFGKGKNWHSQEADESVSAGSTIPERSSFSGLTDRRRHNFPDHSFPSGSQFQLHAVTCSLPESPG